MRGNGDPGFRRAWPAGRRRRRARWRTAAALALVVLVSACAGGQPDDRRAQPSSSPPVPVSEETLVVPVIPIGGDEPGGRQTLEGALADVDAAAAIGAGGIALTADVRWLCGRTTCSTAPLDPVVARAGERGLRVHLQVNSSPGWMAERGRWYAPTGPDADRWAALFAQFVARYGTDVATYEVWNEPNIDDFWAQGPDAGEYADLLRAVWQATQEVNPDVTLVGGVLSNNDLGYMSELSRALAERGGDAENGYYYDVLGVHPYAGERGEGYDPRLPAGSMEGRSSGGGAKDMTFLGVERLREQVAEDEGIERDVYLGEFGYTTTEGEWYHVPEPRRSEWMAAALRQAADWEWVVGFAPYRYDDADDDGFAILGTPTEQALVDTAGTLRE
ncbi:GH39 family glycosyl hydrolase [Blastococcus sp. SYSU DS0617]